MEGTDVLAESCFLTAATKQALIGTGPGGSEKRGTGGTTDNVLGKVCCQRKQRHREVSGRRYGR